MTELKNCPFCGGTVKIARMDDYWMITRGTELSRCTCRVFMESDPFFPTADGTEQKEALIKRWNRRAGVNK